MGNPGRAFRRGDGFGRGRFRDRSGHLGRPARRSFQRTSVPRNVPSLGRGGALGLDIDGPNSTPW
eukprot:4308864-Pyramimonas_sp.AAC.1